MVQLPASLSRHRPGHPAQLGGTWDTPFPHMAATPFPHMAASPAHTRAVPHPMLPQRHARVSLSSQRGGGAGGVGGRPPVSENDYLLAASHSPTQLDAARGPPGPPPLLDDSDYDG